MEEKPERRAPREPEPRAPDARVLGLALLALSALALLLRLPDALDWPLWFDEAETWYASRAGWVDLVRWRAHPHHPPLSFALVRLVTEVLGSQDELALRLPSLVAGILAVPGAYVAGRMGISHRVGLGWAALIAVHPNLVFLGLTARMYSILVLLMLVAFILALDLARRDRASSWRWVGLGAVLAAACATHHLGFALWAGLGVAVADRARRLEAAERTGFGRGFGVASLVVVASLVPAAPRLRAHLWYPADTIGYLLRGGALSDLQAIPLPSLGPKGLLVVGALVLALLALLLLGVPGLLLAVRRSRFFAMTLVCPAVLSLPIVFFASSFLLVGLGRYLLPVTLAWMVGFTALAFESNRRWASVLWVLVVLLFTLISIAYPRPGLFDTGETMRRVASDPSSRRSNVLFHPCRRALLGTYYGLRPVPEPESLWSYACPWEPGEPLPRSTTWLVVGDAWPGSERLHAIVTDLGERYAVDFGPDDLDRLLRSHVTLAIRFAPGELRVLVPDRAVWPEGVWSPPGSEPRDDSPRP